MAPVPNNSISAAGFFEEMISIEQSGAENESRQKTYETGASIEKRQWPGA